MLAAVGTAALLHAASAATFNIPDGDVAALKGAIATANTNGEDDVMELAPNGKYVLYTSDNLDPATEYPTGLPQILADGGKKLEIRGNRATIQRDSPYTTPQFRIFYVAPGANLSLVRVTVSWGRSNRGGGIYNDAATLTLTNTTLALHAAIGGAEIGKPDAVGGAIYSAGGIITAIHSDISGYAKGDLAMAGTIYIENGQLEITDSLISGRADRRSGAITSIGGTAKVTRSSVANAIGGGIFATGTLLVQESKFRNNTTGGAIESHGSATITNCSFDHNSSYFGGAIYNSGVLNLSNSFLGGGSAGNAGGGVYMEDSNAQGTITNCTFYENTAEQNGGAIANLGGGALRIVNSTFVHNERSAGGGGADQVSGKAEIGNNIFKRATTAGVNLQGSAGSFVSLGYNISNDSGRGHLTGPGDQVSTDALVEGPADNGGPAQTIALRPGSPALDRGKDFSGTGLDQRGRTRPYDDPQLANAPGGDGSDIGAFERNPNTPPNIVSLTSPQTVPCSSPQGAPATITVQAEDANQENLTVQWEINGTLVQNDQISGGAGSATLSRTFPIGTSTVKVSVSDGVNPAITQSTSVTVEGGCHAVSGAAFVSQQVPSTMKPGSDNEVRITMHNTGNTTWTYADRFKLASQNPADNTTWGFNRVKLPTNVAVAPGASYTFIFVVRAPAVGGTYNFQWRMIQEGVARFGSFTTNVAVYVPAPVSNARFLSQTVPTTMQPGHIYRVAITMQNNGNTTWRFVDRFKLGSENPADNLTWGVNRARMNYNDSAPPGTAYTFFVDVTAPANPGTYNFQWRMLQEGVNRFGNFTPNVLINVQ